MSLKFLIIGAIGILLGLRFRVPALIAATFVDCVLVFVDARVDDPSLAHVLRLTLISVLLLQASYLVGLLLAFLGRYLRPAASGSAIRRPVRISGRQRPSGGE